MQLKDFLLTADADHAVALQQAKDYEVIEPVFITSNTLTVYVVGAGLYDVFTDVANDTTSPVRGICMALMDRLRGASEFNLSETLPLGQANIGMLNALIAALPQYEPAISNLKATLIAVSNKTVKPFANVTLHDVLLTRNAVPFADVTINGGYAVLTTTADCPVHNPRLMAQSANTGLWRRVNNFTAISAAGVYECMIPAEARGLPLKVDNAYGVI